MVARWQLAALSSAVTAALLVHFIPAFSVATSYTWTFIGLFTTYLFSSLAWTVIIWPKMVSPLRHLPEPTGGNFFLGQFPRILRDPSGVPMLDWVNEIPNDGLIRYTTIFNKERILPTSPKALAEVLVTKNYEFIKPPELRAGLGRILGVGLLLAEGDEHKNQRKNLMPAFAYRHIKDLYPVFWSKSLDLVKVISFLVETESAYAGNEKEAAPTSVLEMGSWLSRATLDIIGVAGMGQTFDAINDPDTELNVTYRSIFEPSRQGRILGLMGLVFPPWLLAWIPVKRNDDITSAAATIRNVSRQLIRQKKQSMDEKGATVGKDILSVALQSGGFTEDNLVDQLMTFLAAGHETTASSTIWALLALCQNPDMQKRLRDEVRTNLPSLDDDSNSATAESMDRLPYLHAVCNEVLRLYPPVPLTRRATANDTTILGQFIPKGTDIILAPAAINRSKHLWGEDASDFKPERWMGPGRTNNGGAESNYAMMTFLHGPRSCIGSSFAKAEFACLLAAIVGRFEMELADPDQVIEIATGITQRPKGGLNVRMKVFEGW